MNPNDNNIDGVLYDSNGNPIVKIISLSTDALPNNPMSIIIPSQEEFSCTVTLSEEDSASLWGICEGLEIIDGGNNNV